MRGEGVVLLSSFSQKYVRCDDVLWWCYQFMEVRGCMWSRVVFCLFCSSVVVVNIPFCWCWKLFGHPLLRPWCCSLWLRDVLSILVFFFQNSHYLSKFVWVVSECQEIIWRHHLYALVVFALWVNFHLEICANRYKCKLIILRRI